MSRKSVPQGQCQRQEHFHTPMTAALCHEMTRLVVQANTTRDPAKRKLFEELAYQMEDKLKAERQKLMKADAAT